MNISAIPAVPGARHRRKRVGRGIGSGHGKTSTRGQKGQRARTGSGKRPGFEGGRNPLIRRLPKRGFRRKERGGPVPLEIINVKDLNRFQDGERITPERLMEAGLVRHPSRQVKLLGDGALTRRVAVSVHRISEAAKEKILQGGGTIELLTTEPQKGHGTTEGKPA
ncbi:MAG: 50S ribosomal protein L15 [Candidatus Omnitrophica bacterium]|nr:50S ribosomal protein L15 [Candidatus Omnitrophota bacterium]